MAGFLELWHDNRSILLSIIFLAIIVVQVSLHVKSKKIYPRSSLSNDEKAPANVLRAQINASKTIPHFDIAASKSLSNIQRAPKRIQGTRLTTGQSTVITTSFKYIHPTIFFSSLSGATEKAAHACSNSIVNSLRQNGREPIFKLLPPKILDLSYIDYDDYFTSLPGSKEETANFYLILIPTYNIDTVLTNFLEHLRETHHDFRVDTAPLRDILGYSVFGFGDQQEWPTEATGFCSQAIEVDKWLAKLTARRRAYPLGMGDVRSDAPKRLKDWVLGISGVLSDLANGKTLGEGVPGAGDAVESDEEDEMDEADDLVALKNKKQHKRKNPLLEDVENIGVSETNKRSSTQLAIDFTSYKAGSTKPNILPKEMVPKSSPTYAALTKQGYTIVGSHSGVKICRWTKSALRGRGSCYKFSFYGIKSHLCMETTPSLSCSNKCVFCWRHGTNPVGTTWRWQVDQPEVIFSGVKEGHYKKIKMMRGVPGVRAERFEEAMKIRHCALSLVGEPIFYPYINEFTALLHNEHISSFLVCNAQHPDQLATLRPVTQLYVSIDASNRESLRKIDRPLHRDFWERFCRCLDILKEKRFRQRTVYRLTLVKGFNIEDEAEGYADLVERGLPCFVEVKGVTYCGTSSSAGAGLTMQNVPFYEEVVAFVEALNAALERRGLKYGIAAEHAHSCCILLASDRFYKEGKWHTVIDYTKFFELLESGASFAPEDYTAPTPEWALWGNGGFDPADERVYRKGTKKAQHQANIALSV